MIETIHRIPGAPRLALLTDMHDRPFEAVAASLRAHRPPLICIAGDILHRLRPEDDRSLLETQARALPFLAACADIAPTFLSLGNHEQGLSAADLERIRSVGVTVLDNSWATRDGLVIGGLTSGSVLKYRRLRAEAAAQAARPGRSPGLDALKAQMKAPPDTGWLAAYCAAPGLHVLLCHHPEYFPLVPESVPLVLSGHAHGGQWRFYNPFRRRWDGVYAPGQGLWPRWTRGVYDGRLVVSAGLANTASVPRLFNPTEIVYLEGTQ